MMKKIFLLVCLTFVFSGKAYPQMHKGMERLGLAGAVSTVDRQNVGSLEFRVGNLLTRHVEFDIEMALMFVDFLQSPDGAFRGGLIYHFFPAEKVVPGAGFTFGVPFLFNRSSVVTEFTAFFNLDYFATLDWSFNLKTGYQRLDYSSGIRSHDGMIMRFGFSVFRGKG